MFSDYASADRLCRQANAQISQAAANLKAAGDEVNAKALQTWSDQFATVRGTIQKLAAASDGPTPAPQAKVARAAGQKTPAENVPPANE